MRRLFLVPDPVDGGEGVALRRAAGAVTEECRAVGIQVINCFAQLGDALVGLRRKSLKLKIAVVGSWRSEFPGAAGLDRAAHLVTMDQ